MNPSANLYSDFLKRAAAILTPEAEQAAVQPQQDPAAMGGMPPQGAPMDPAMAGGMPPQGGAPMDPAMMGGQPPMDPAAMGGMPPQGGAGLPPEIMQDQEFLMFLQSIGIQLDPASGMAMDPNGQPVPPEAIMQIYQEFNMQRQQMAAQGGAPGGEMPPDAAGGMPPEGGAAPQDDMLNQLASVVFDAIDSRLQEYTSELEKKFGILTDKMEALLKSVDALTDTTDRRSEEDKKSEERLQEDLDADLMPTDEAPVEPQPFPIPEEAPKTASVMQPISLFQTIVAKV